LGAFWEPPGKRKNRTFQLTQTELISILKNIRFTWAMGQRQILPWGLF
jgi:hypothetical protein